MGPAFQPFAVPIFNRCVQIIHSNLQQAATAASDPNREMPDTDFLVTSLDLLSTLIQALDEMSIALVASARPHFFELLCLCLSVCEYPQSIVHAWLLHLIGSSQWRSTICICIVGRLRHICLPTITPMVTSDYGSPHCSTGPEYSGRCWRGYYFLRFERH